MKYVLVEHVKLAAMAFCLQFVVFCLLKMILLS
jgi:hypothetical protein